MPTTSDPPLSDPETRARLSLPGRPTRVSRRSWLFAVSSLLVVALIIVAREVLLPFILALVIAYVFTPSVVWLERHRVPRWVGVLAIYSVTLGTAYGFGVLALPRIIAEGRNFGREVPKNLKIVEEQLIPEWETKFRAFVGGATAVPPVSSGPLGAPVPPVEPEEWKPAVRITPRDDGSFDLDVGSGVEIRQIEGGGYRLEEVERKRKRGMAERLRSFVERNYVQLARGGVEVVGSVARGIFLFFMTLMVAAYLMLTHERIIAFFRGLVRPPARRDFDRLLARVDDGLSGVVRGQLLICLVNGVLTAIGFAFIGLKYWPVLALIGGVGSLIPIFGSIMSSVPAVAIGLTQSPATAMLVLGWILFIHQVEANYLNPKIIGVQAKLHPVLIIFVLLVGQHFYQAAGALLAVPCLSIAQSLFLHFREVADRDELEFPG